VLVGDDDSESLVVVHLLGPDDAGLLRPERLHDGQVRVEERIDEDDEEVIPFGVGPRELHGAGRSVLNLLLHESGVEIGIFLADVRLDLLLQVPGDEDGLVDAELTKVVEDIAHHRLVPHPDQRLGRDVGVGAETGALSCQGDDDFHESSLD